MRILVIDDSMTHRKAAEILLKDHDATIVATYDEAQKLLTKQIDWEKLSSQMIVEGLSDESPRDATWNAAYERAKEDATTRPNFDAVLCDLLLPASEQAQGKKGRVHVGTEMPLGTTLAFLALAAGIKRVAVVTDTNHHNHPASAAFDHFKGAFSAGDVRVFCTNRSEYLAPMDERTFEIFSWDFYRTREFEERFPYNEETKECTGIQTIKNWQKVLDQLIGAN